MQAEECKSIDVRPDFRALQTQAETVHIVVGDQESKSLNPLVGISACSVTDELGLMFSIRGLTWKTVDRPPVAPGHDIIDEYLNLRNSSEVFYTVPKNTTLVEVLGPAGKNIKWQQDFGECCYAFLNPRPSWMQKAHFPLSRADGDFNTTDQPMFFLPVDPEIQYEVRVGSYGNATTCPVSGFRTYPFH